MVPASRSAYGPPKAAVLAFAGALILAGLAADSTGTSAVVALLGRSRVAWAFAALMALACASTLVSVDPSQSFAGSYPDYRGLVSFGAFVVTGIGAALLVGAGQAAFITRGAGVAACLVGALGLLQRLGAVPGARFESGLVRIPSTLGNSSNLGVWIVLALPLAILCAWTERQLVWRIVGGAGAALALACLLWTNSRGAWLGLAAAGAIGLVLGSLRLSTGQRRRLWLAAAATVIAAGIGVWALAPGVASRAMSAFTGTSRSGAIRLSTWRSSVRLAAGRPLLGWGPNTFQYVFPRYREPGQIDGAFEYQVTEAAHNIGLDTAAALGFPALTVLLAGAALCGAALLRVARARPNEGLPLATAVALGGGFVALQFHYVTMDAGPLLGVLLGVVVALEAGERADAQRVPSETVAWMRRIAACGATAFGLAALLAVGGLYADVGAGAAMRAAASGVPWSEVAGQLTRAARMGAWEPAYERAVGSVALAVEARIHDPDAVDSGDEALANAARRLPLDPTALAEHGELVYLVGVKAHDDGMLRRALQDFDAVVEMDPANGVPLARRGVLLASLGDLDGGAAVLERALALSPAYLPGIESLAETYRLMGDPRYEVVAGRADELRRLRVEFRHSDSGESD